MTFRFCVNREKPFSAIAIVAKFVTQLLKVIQTWSWAQNDHNICNCKFIRALLTLLSSKLYALPFLHKLRTVFWQNAKTQLSKVVEIVI